MPMPPPRNQTHLDCLVTILSQSRQPADPLDPDGWSLIETRTHQALRNAHYGEVWERERYSGHWVRVR